MPTMILRGVAIWYNYPARRLIYCEKYMRTPEIIATCSRTTAIYDSTTVLQLIYRMGYPGKPVYGR